MVRGGPAGLRAALPSGKEAPGGPAYSQEAQPALLGRELEALKSVWGCIRLVLFPTCSLGQVP